VDPEQLARRRFEYETVGLDIVDVDPDPIAQWWRWYREAVEADITEPNAMVVATVDAEGRPDARFVLVRSVDEKGFSFYGNFGSAKGRQIAGTGVASITFGWLQLHRQVRVRGTAHTFSDAEADTYWASRPRDSQLASAASPQSQVIANREELDLLIVTQTRLWAGVDDVPRPDTWGGFRVVPEVVEFWQGRPARTHDRLRYRLVEGAWVLERLAP
jgi:pyridoxamine 5'-phosphate oxidase